ncbi:MAG: glutamate synthase (NADPH/NADH) small chain [Chloroflexi bacterium]|nr:MAG: glutamate synthase (NADPH/NADH) small chain [Chloroflexota bacterium]
MGKTTGFKEFPRHLPPKRPVDVRIQDHLELYERWPRELVQTQASRCMDCGIPFCHTGCPLGNLIPEWNELTYQDRWDDALRRLLATNNFPEFTGRICPAPCEVSCTLAINQDPITIELIEKTISDVGFEQGRIQPEPPSKRTGKTVAVVGSGPAGLAAAQQLNRAGHRVTVFERDEVVGGLLRLGIPDFKLPAEIVQRRVDLMAEEGIDFRTGAHVGVTVQTSELRNGFDAIVLATGATVPRDLPVPGRELDGVHFAMEYLPQQNRVNAGAAVPDQILATGKRVVILGGGDTGADCLGTAHRQGAASVTQFELLPEPPSMRTEDNPWPQWSRVLRLSPAHAEGGERDYNISTTGLSGSQGRVEALHGVRVGWAPQDGGRPNMEPVSGSDFQIDADLVLLAMGFVHPEQDTVVKDLGVDLDGRGNIGSDAGKMTSADGVFVAGDARRGQSLVVWAIAEGRATAHGLDKYLMGETNLPWVQV